MTLLRNNRSKAYALLLVNASLWGMIPPIAKNAYQFISPYQLLFGRFLLAGVIFLPIYLIFFYNPQKVHRTNPKSLLIQSLLSTPLTLLPLYLGLQYTSALEASILVASGPIFTVIAGVIILKDKITKKECLGILFSMLGTLLLIIKPLLLDGPNMKLSLLGNILIILSNLIWTTFIIYQKKRPTDSSTLSLTSSLVSIPFFLAFIFFMNPTQNIISPLFQTSVTLPLVYLAIFGTIIAFWAHTEAQNLISASEAAIFSYLQPIFAFPLAIFWLGEPLSSTAIFSFVLIILGVYISETHRKMI